MTHAVRVVVGVGAALCLLSVSSPANASRPARLTDAKDGFSFGLPTGWKQESISSLTKQANQLAQSDPSDAQAILSSIEGVRDYAYESIPAPGFGPNVTVELFPNAPTVKAILRNIKTQTLYTEHVSYRQVDTAAGEAVELTGGSTFQQGSVEFSTVYTLPHGGKTYQVTVSTVSQKVSNAAASVMMSSWRWLPSP
jgi:hypothetical protein